MFTYLSDDDNIEEGRLQAILLHTVAIDTDHTGTAVLIQGTGKVLQLDVDDDGDLCVFPLKFYQS